MHRSGIVFLILAATVATHASDVFIDRYLEVVDVASQRQLLVDDHVLLDVTGARRTFHAARTLPKPVLEPGPYDEGLLIPMSALYDRHLGRFRLWYISGDSKYRALCYAESEDGIHFARRPSTPDGHPTVRDEPRNRVGIRDRSQPDTFGHMPLEAMCVFRDEADPDPRRRYKMIHGSRRHRLAVSADGYAWWDAGVAMTFHPGLYGAAKSSGQTDECNGFCFDPMGNRWLAFLCEKAPNAADYNLRRLVFYESADLAGWRRLAGDLSPDERDGAGAQVYWMTGFAHAGMIIGLPYMFYTDEHARPDWRDRAHVAVAFSRDGVDWQRPSRDPFIARGDPSAWDGGMVAVYNGIVVHGDRMYFYYWGTPKLHGPPPPGGKHAWAAGCALLRRDGFASLSASDRAGSAGQVLTKQLRFEGDRLFINADTRAGEIRVELLIDGFRVDPKTTALDRSWQHEADLSDPIRIDATDHVVTWGGDPDLGRLAGKVLRVRFHLEGDARLYAFQFGPVARARE